MDVRTQIGRFIAFFFQSLLWSLNLLLVLYTCLAYWLLYSLQTEHWLAGMIMITLPVAWFLNLVVVLLWLFSFPWRSWLSGLVVLAGLLLFGSRTIELNTPSALTTNAIPFRVFSYNVHQFDETQSPDQAESSPRMHQMLNYVLHYDAPIKCFQEFYSANNVPDYNMVDRLRRAGYRYSALLHPEQAQVAEGDIGVAIFSIYPIVKSGHEVFGSHNGLVWADVKLNRDTVRIIDVHLHSMGIRVGRVLHQKQIKGVQHETRGVLSALRTGFIERKEEVVRVEDYIRTSPYPVVVTGDFNDTPYSVVYERLRRVLPNAFEDAGRGFGFSYNRLPGFIRIDNQFYSPGLQVLNFETINYASYSDHYPVVGTYAVKK